jgi:hypothetical protein
VRISGDLILGFLQITIMVVSLRIVIAPTLGVEIVGLDWPATSRLEVFNRFMTNKPVVLRAVFSVSDSPDDPNSARRRYWCKWQTNAFIVREVSAQGGFAANSESTNAHRLIGGLTPGGEHWLVMYNNHYSWTNRKDLSTGAGQSSPMLNQHRMLQDILAKVLNLGMLNTEVGSVQSDSGEFFADHLFNGTRVIGRLLSDSGTPSSLELKYGSAKISVEYKYSREKGGAPELPDEWVMSGIDRSRSVPSKLGRIYLEEISCASQPLDREEFSSAPFLRRDFTRIFQVTNSLFWLSDTGLVRIHDPRPPWREQQDGSLVPRIWAYLAFALLAITPLFWWLKAKRNQRRE